MIPGKTSFASNEVASKPRGRGSAGAGASGDAGRRALGRKGVSHCVLLSPPLLPLPPATPPLGPFVPPCITFSGTPPDCPGAERGVPLPTAPRRATEARPGGVKRHPRAEREVSERVVLMDNSFPFVAGVHRYLLSIRAHPRSDVKDLTLHKELKAMEKSPYIWAIAL